MSDEQTPSEGAPSKPAPASEAAPQPQQGGGESQGTTNKPNPLNEPAAPYGMSTHSRRGDGETKSDKS